MLENGTARNGEEALLFSRYVSNVYNVNSQEIEPAQPRARLREFGGDLTRDEFHSTTTAKVLPTPSPAIFVVASPLIYERAESGIGGMSESTTNGTWITENLRRPHDPQRLTSTTLLNDNPIFNDPPTNDALGVTSKTKKRKKRK